MNNTALVPAEKFDVSTDLSDDMLEITGKDAAGGAVSFDPQDQLLPLIYVLQGLSPQVQKRGEGYVQGAEPGHFWLRGSLEPIRNGESGIKVIPCAMQRTWIEWLPNRQGFVGRHEHPPEGTQSRKVRGDDGAERSVLMCGDNIIQDTREFYVMVDGHPFVLPCTSTKHKFAREWQSYFHQLIHPKTGNVMPTTSQLYLLTTVPQSNSKGEWFGLQFQFLGFLKSKAMYEQAKAFEKAIRKGERKPEAPLAGAEGDGRDGEIPF